MKINPLFDILIDPDNGPWRAVSFGPKPPLCNSCRYQGIGQGFIPDRIDAESRLILALPKPGSKDSDSCIPGETGTARSIINNLLAALPSYSIKPSENRRSDLPAWIGVTSTIRCLPPVTREGREYRRRFPEGKDAEAATRGCLQYDHTSVNRDGDLIQGGGIASLNPDYYMITQAPDPYHKQPAFRALIDADMLTAAQLVLSDPNIRVAVLFGPDVYSSLFPALAAAGGAKAWRGSLFKRPAGGWNRGYAPALANVPYGRRRLSASALSTAPRRKAYIRPHVAAEAPAETAPKPRKKPAPKQLSLF